VSIGTKGEHARHADQEEHQDDRPHPGAPPRVVEDGQVRQAEQDEAAGCLCHRPEPAGHPRAGQAAQDAARRLGRQHPAQLTAAGVQSAGDVHREQGVHHALADRGDADEDQDCPRDPVPGNGAQPLGQFVTQVPGPATTITTTSRPVPAGDQRARHGGGREGAGVQDGRAA
jgi:hypothetical protein